MRILFIGDLYGEPGMKILEEQMDNLKKEHRPNLIIVNAENVANGKGINKEYYLRIMKLGVHAITMGNWTYGNNDLLTFIDDSKVIRPANFLNAPGVGYKKINFNGKTVLVINMLGRIFMNGNVENPFTLAKQIVESENADYIFIDFHAEATSEKVALGHYLDGKVDAIVGTHTHIQTNDHRKLDNGTLYISDVGMTGPLNGVIGVDKEIVISRFLNGYATGNQIAKGKRQLNGVILDLDKKTINTIHLEDK